MLERKKNQIPKFVSEALADNGVIRDFEARPDYQRNDYIGWINSAKLDRTKQKRLNQMIKELKAGGVYMNMKHSASEKDSKK